MPARRAGQIAIATRRGYLPPWLPEHGHGDFAGGRRLTRVQIEMIERWAGSGAPEGDPARRPAPPSFASNWTLGRPDLIIEAAKALDIPADGPDLFWNFVLRQAVGRTRFVRAVEIRPGNTRVVHHANLLVDRERSSRRREPSLGAGFPGMDLTFATTSSSFSTWRRAALPSPVLPDTPPKPG